ncbi:hypothetical protein QCA50_007223 [Cerrena zonata]|uniref:C2H2-type domain-containing protein n=1 Tax=Cerrena zonata TaxID=2478898 RepID=A0AAW0GIZ5_9APHY
MSDWFNWDPSLLQDSSDTILDFFRELGEYSIDHSDQPPPEPIGTASSSASKSSDTTQIQNSATVDSPRGEDELREQDQNSDGVPQPIIEKNNPADTKVTSLVPSSLKSDQFPSIPSDNLTSDLKSFSDFFDFPALGEPPLMTNSPLPLNQPTTHSENIIAPQPRAIATLPSDDDLANYVQNISRPYLDGSRLSIHSRTSTTHLFLPYDPSPQPPCVPFPSSQLARRSTYPSTRHTSLPECPSLSSVTRYNPGRPIAPLPIRPHHRAATLPTHLSAPSVSGSRHSTTSSGNTLPDNRGNKQMKRNLDDDEDPTGYISESKRHRGRLPRTAHAEPGKTYACQWVTNERACGEMVVAIPQLGPTHSGRTEWDKHLNTHLKDVTGGTEVQCQWKHPRNPRIFCSHTCKRNRLSRHIVDEHLGRNDQQCGRCKKWFAGGARGLASHMSKIHK